MNLNLPGDKYMVPVYLAISIVGSVFRRFVNRFYFFYDSHTTSGNIALYEIKRNILNGLFLNKLFCRFGNFNE